MKVLAMLLLAVVLAACAGTGLPTAAPSGDAAAADASPSPGPGPDVSAAPGPTPDVGPSAGSAPAYRTDLGILEGPSGGPVLCSSFMESLPPQCEGPPVEGLEWDTVAGVQRAGGTTWVNAVGIVGTWDGARFTLTQPPGPSFGIDVHGATDVDFSPGCPRPEVLDGAPGDQETAGRGLAAVDEDVHVTGWISRPPAWDGPLTATVVVTPGARPAATRAVREHYRGRLCVIERDAPTLAERVAIQEEIHADRDTPLGYVFGSSAGGIRPVVEVTVMLATDEAEAWVRERWGDAVELRSVLQPVP